MFNGLIIPGERFIWEAKKDHARCEIIVTEIVKCENDEDKVFSIDVNGDGEEYWSDESRFREACTLFPQWELSPEERTDGFECLAFHRGKWRHVKWSSDHKGWHLGYAGPFMADVDRPFTHIPENTPERIGTDTFYGWKE